MKIFPLTAAPVLLALRVMIFRPTARSGGDSEIDIVYDSTSVGKTLILSIISPDPCGPSEWLAPDVPDYRQSAVR